MKDELSGQIIKEFVGNKAKHNWVKNNNDKDKKAKGTIKCVIKTKLENKINHLEKIHLTNLLKWYG